MEVFDLHIFIFVTSDRFVILAYYLCREKIAAQNILVTAKSAFSFLNNFGLEILLVQLLLQIFLFLKILIELQL